VCLNSNPQLKPTQAQDVIGAAILQRLRDITTTGQAWKGQADRMVVCGLLTSTCLVTSPEA
jgi:hypothetical protein